jgi:hypothetical protein
VLLMRRLGFVPAEYQDPQTGRHARDETGADALIEGRGAGIQVTDLDTGDLPGEVDRETAGDRGCCGADQGEELYERWRGGRAGT